jgi:hypothetical protein
VGVALASPPAVGSAATGGGTAKLTYDGSILTVQVTGVRTNRAYANCGVTVESRSFNQRAFLFDERAVSANSIEPLLLETDILDNFTPGVLFVRALCQTSDDAADVLSKPTQPQDERWFAGKFINTAD